MELSIQERLKDLRVERGLTLEQLAEQTHLSKSALGSYEGDNLKDISHYALIELAKFYEVTVDYLLGRSQTRNHPNADLADLHLSDDMIELLKSGLVDNSLLCELATHPDFPRLMADLEIYVNGVAGKQVQSANAIVDAVSATIMKQHNPGLTDPQLRQLIAAHIDDDSFCRYVIQQDINKIALDLREAHKDDFFSVPEDNPLEDFLQTAEETTREDSDPPKICSEVLNQYFHSVRKGSTIRLEGFDDRLRRRAEIMEQIDRLQKEQNSIEQEVKLYMQDNEYAASDSYRISWSSVQSTRLDAKRMKEELPDIYRDYAVQSVSRRFQIKAA